MWFNQYLSDFDYPVYLSVAHFWQTGADPFIEIHLMCLWKGKQVVIKIFSENPKKFDFMLFKAIQLVAVCLYLYMIR